MFELRLSFELKLFFVFILSALFTMECSAAGFDFVHFKCSRRDNRLLSQVRFYYDEEKHLVGELDVYSTTGGERSFLSGDMLYQPQYVNGSIVGAIGDVNADIETFKITPLEIKKSGLWHFIATANGEKILDGNFNCSYPDNVYP